jgi:hemerythrin
MCSPKNQVALTGPPAQCPNEEGFFMTAKQRNRQDPQLNIDEHDRLRHVVEAVQEVLATRKASSDVVAAMLRELTANVLDHFNFEEEGGYFADAIERAPRLSEHAEHLLSQHAVMTAQLVALEEHAARQESDEQWWTKLNAMFANFLEAFLAHETEENVLLQTAFNEDIGAED